MHSLEKNYASTSTVFCWVIFVKIVLLLFWLYKGVITYSIVWIIEAKLKSLEVFFGHWIQEGEPDKAIGLLVEGTVYLLASMITNGRLQTVFT